MIAAVVVIEISQYISSNMLVSLKLAQMYLHVLIRVQLFEPCHLEENLALDNVQCKVRTVDWQLFLTTSNGLFGMKT